MEEKKESSKQAKAATFQKVKELPNGGYVDQHGFEHSPGLSQHERSIEDGFYEQILNDTPKLIAVLGLEKDALTFDSVLGNFKSSTDKINQTLEITKGGVDIVYTRYKCNNYFRAVAFMPLHHLFVFEGPQVRSSLYLWRIELDCVISVFWDWDVIQLVDNLLFVKPLDYLLNILAYEILVNVVTINMKLHFVSFRGFNLVTLGLLAELLLLYGHDLLP